MITIIDISFQNMSILLLSGRTSANFLRYNVRRITCLFSCHLGVLKSNNLSVSSVLTHSLRRASELRERLFQTGPNLK
jgi:hypothetical protein